MNRIAFTAALATALAFSAQASGRPARPPDPSAYMTRLEQAAILSDFNARLLAGNSATRTLEDWCLAHRLAPVAKITAERIAGPDKPVAAATRARLEIGPDEPVRYRRVHLKCGDATLSQADNWYVPSRLTAAMNAALDGSDTPFGQAVAPLGISRKTVGVRQFWMPMDEGWEMRSRAANVATYGKDRSQIPDFIIEHRAIVLDRTMKPIAEVVETYTKANLDFAQAGHTGH